MKPQPDEKEYDTEEEKDDEKMSELPETKQYTPKVKPRSGAGSLVGGRTSVFHCLKEKITRKLSCS